MLTLIKKIVKEIHFFLRRIDLKKNNVSIEARVSFYRTVFSTNCKIYKNTRIDRSSIGSYTYISSNCYLNNVEIGSYTSIGPNVEVIYGTHPISYISSSPVFYSTRNQCGTSFVKTNVFKEFNLIQISNRSAQIGNDVWIGYGAKLIEGISIGNGAIVLAGAYVTKDVEPYSIVGGIPAKHLKYRFPEDHRRLLLEFAWWKKDIKWIKSNVNLFLNSGMFLDRIKALNKTHIK